MNLNDRLKKHHITLQKKYGQNFIGDPALLERIATVCDWQPGDRALEIGPGAGTLTPAAFCHRPRSRGGACRRDRPPSGAAA